MSKTRRQRPSTAKPTTTPGALRGNYYRGQQRSGSKVRRTWRTWLYATCAISVLFLIGAGLYGSRIEAVDVRGVASEDSRRSIASEARERHTFLWESYVSSERSWDLPAEVASVSLQPQWSERTLLVQVKLHEPALAWESGQRMYALNKQGTVIGKGSRPPGVPLVRDESDLEVEIGEAAVPGQFVDFVTSISDSGLDTSRLRVVETTRELYADTPRGYYIRFDTEGDPQVQVNNARNVRDVAQENGHSINDYIDARIPYRAYYR